MTPEYFGAIGDGVTDDTAAIEAWLAWEYHRSVGGYVMLPLSPGKTYKIGRVRMPWEEDQPGEEKKP
jgi:hypothetical protein